MFLQLSRDARNVRSLIRQILTDGPPAPTTMQKYRVYQVDAFTTRRFTGNPAGVIPNAHSLSDTDMQAIARELNNSETAFIFRLDARDHDVRVRFFTPTSEVPSCGPATTAAHYVRALEEKLPASTLVQKIGAGTLPLDVAYEGVTTASS